MSQPPKKTMPKFKARARARKRNADLFARAEEAARLVDASTETLASDAVEAVAKAIGAPQRRRKKDR